MNNRRRILCNGEKDIIAFTSSYSTPAQKVLKGLYDDGLIKSPTQITMKECHSITSLSKKYTPYITNCLNWDWSFYQYFDRATYCNTRMDGVGADYNTGWFIVYPSGLKGIGDYYVRTNSPATIVFLSTVPPSIASRWSDGLSGYDIYVPEGSLADYQSAFDNKWYWSSNDNGTYPRTNGHTFFNWHTIDELPSDKLAKIVMPIV